MAETTTVSIPKALKRDLDALRGNPRETYSDIIGRLVECARDGESGLEFSEATLKKIAQAREDMRKGRVYTSREMAKRLGL
jgi:predicted transcriptional regulator